MKINDLNTGNEEMPYIPITIHEFVDHDTWSLHLALHANGILVGTASAKLGNSKYDQETVVAAMQCLKNDYFKAIGSPMRYENGKLLFLAPDNGMSIEKKAEMQMNGQEDHYYMAASRKMPQKIFA
ncbi:hypothetical protein [Methanomethylovorans sp.]|uniref:hypothetical protein n=1 Tax=Methanomethylovorans sp. TaxID=2758717 RepID=UPI00351C7E4A